MHALGHGQFSVHSHYNTKTCHGEPYACSYQWHYVAYYVQCIVHHSAVYVEVRQAKLMLDIRWGACHSVVVREGRSAQGNVAALVPL